MATRRRIPSITVALDSCGQCTYFQQNKGEDDGVCYGMPPQVITTGEILATYRPYVKPVDRACSLFRPKVLNA